jgi:hypothetical protein
MMMQMPGSGPNELLFIQNMVETVMVSLVMGIVGWPLARAIGRRIERRGPDPAQLPDVTQRLARIEAAVDTIAVEVERMAEAQRFTTRLLSDGRKGAGGSPQ